MTQSVFLKAVWSWSRPRFGCVRRIKSSKAMKLVEKTLRRVCETWSFSFRRSPTGHASKNLQAPKSRKCRLPNEKEVGAEMSRVRRWIKSCSPSTRESILEGRKECFAKEKEETQSKC